MWISGCVSVGFLTPFINFFNHSTSSISSSLILRPFFGSPPPSSKHFLCQQNRCWNWQGRFGLTSIDFSRRQACSTSQTTWLLSRRLYTCSNVAISLKIMASGSSKCFPLQPQAFSAARGKPLPLTPRAYPDLRIALPGVVAVGPTGPQLETGSQLSLRFLLFWPFGLVLDQYKPKLVRTRRVRVRFHPEEGFLTHQMDSPGRKI